MPYLLYLLINVKADSLWYNVDSSMHWRVETVVNWLCFLCPTF